MKVTQHLVKKPSKKKNSAYIITLYRSVKCTDSYRETTRVSFCGITDLRLYDVRNEIIEKSKTYF